MVFLVGLEEGVFPHVRSIGDPDQLEEERRLAYVAITRARERLYLSYAWSRMLFGSSQYNPPSRFLEEIPAGLVEEVGRRKRRGAATASFQSQAKSAYGTRSSGSDRPFGAARDRMVESALAPRGPMNTGAEELGIRVGDDVRHAKWGDGVVLRIDGHGAKAEALIRFPERGEKLLLLSWAPLQKI